MDVILHLGAHRTGTTAFQAFLQANRGGLAAAGTAVWLPRDLRSGPLAGLSRRPGGGLAALADLGLARRIARALAALRAEGMVRLILSEENLLGTMAACHAAADPYPDAARRLARLDRLFAGRIARVGLAVREPADWWASTLAFRLARGGPVPDAALIDRMARAPRGWAELVAELSGALPGRGILAWDHAKLVDRPRHLLAALAGCEPPAGLIPVAHGRNARPAPAALLSALRARGVDRLPPGLPAADAGPWMPFAPDQSAAMAARHAADLTLLGTARWPGIEFIGSPGDRPGTGARMEGQTHDRQDRSLGRARRQGAA